MNKSNQLKQVYIDFVAKGKSDDQWLVVLVEQGGESQPSNDFLYSLQNRLYNCLDAILDGELAKKFPYTLNKNITIRVDGYDLFEDEVSEFFANFSEGIFSVPDYHKALDESRYVKNISFELNLEQLKK